MSLTSFVKTVTATTVFVLAPALNAQGAPAGQIDPNAPQGTNPPEPVHKRIFGIIPNYRTAPTLQHYEPLTAREKFKIATQDAFDPGNVLFAAGSGAVGQLTNFNPSFGQGAAGFASYFGTAYADIVIGDYMSEAVFPVLLHQDPRYFRKGTGSGMSRFGYALGRLLVTRNDSGKRAFNFSEVGGNSAAVAISMAYYADNRDVGNAMYLLSLQLGADGASNILKEFWPDIHRKFFERKQQHP